MIELPPPPLSESAFDVLRRECGQRSQGERAAASDWLLHAQWQDTGGALGRVRDRAPLGPAEAWEQNEGNNTSVSGFARRSRIYL